MQASICRMVAVLGLMVAVPHCGYAQDAAKVPAATKLLPDDADAAWAAVEKATQPPAPPKEWNEKAPSQEEIAAFRLEMGKLAGTAADKAKEFRERFPSHARVEKARELERSMLAAAVNLGATNRIEALKAAGDAMQKQSEGLPAVFAQFEKGVRALQKEYPDRPEIYAALLEICEGLPAERALAIAKEIEEAKTEPPLKEQAASIRKKFERLGKPLALSFTSIDGKKIDLAEMKGKVVLIDFWATWCGPCIREMPKVKEAYEKLHPKGFEIVGISFDQDKDALTSYVAKNGVAWTQYFDGEGWGNKFGKEFGIVSIPTMWLVDKKGNLVDLTAREDLTGKVTKLLAE